MTRRTAGTIGAIWRQMCGGQERGIRPGAVDRGAHGAALVVAEHDDERHVEHGDGVLEAADDRVRDHLSGVADDEQVAEALVEDDLGGQARVRASEQRGTRLLARRELVAAFDVLPRVARLARDEARVAALHLVPHLAGVGAVSVIVRSSAKLADLVGEGRRRDLRGLLVGRAVDEHGVGPGLGAERERDVAGARRVGDVVARPTRRRRS